MARRAGTGAEAAAPPWLEPLLATTFFASCTLHGDAARGECNMFCLDCPSAGAFCFYCRSSAHADHRSIQIRRSSYHDVVRVSEVQRALDVSGVQNYVINSARVVFLNERPQPKGTSSSSSGIGGAAKSAAHLCEICSRTLLDPVRFCSLGCKLEGIKRTGGGATFLLDDDGSGGGGGGGGDGGGVGQEPTTSAPRHRRPPDRRRPADRSQDLAAGHVIAAAKPRRRKGIPRRSPLAS